MTMSGRSRDNITHPFEKRKKPCAEEVKKGVHSSEPTKMAQKVSDNRLSGWLQRPAGYPVRWDHPARGNYTGFISRGFPSHHGSSLGPSCAWKLHRFYL